MSLITVYITNYNYGHFIKQAIKSVINQDDVDLELLIIDDGSKDNSKEIIEEYRQLENVTIVYQKNKGLNVTNNVALSLCQGDYIMRLDADDYLEPGALLDLSQKLDKDPELGLVFPDYFIVDSEGELIEHHTRHNFEKEVTLYDQAAHGACTMIRVDFLKALGGYNENYKCQDGYELWVKFTNKYKVANVNKPLFSYRQHGSNLTSNEQKILGTRAQINADYIDSLNINNKAVAIIPIRNVKDKYYNQLLGNRTLLNLKIEQAIQAESIAEVVISCPDIEVKDTIEEVLLGNAKVAFHHRSRNSAKHFTSLNQSILEFIAEAEKKKVNDIISIVILDLQFPLINHKKIDDAVNTMLLFKSDSLISVRQNTAKLFKHEGSGMEPLFDYKSKSRLERDVVYEHIGGITVTKVSSLLDSEEIVNGKVGHMVMDKISSFKIESVQDIEFIKQINSMNNIL